MIEFLKWLDWPAIALCGAMLIAAYYKGIL